jgi:hypothetical protein
MKLLKNTSKSYGRFTAEREIVSTTPLIEPCDNTCPNLFCYAEFKYKDAPNMSLLVLKSDIYEK